MCLLLPYILYVYINSTCVCACSLTGAHLPVCALAGVLVLVCILTHV